MKLGKTTYFLDFGATMMQVIQSCSESTVEVKSLNYVYVEYTPLINQNKALAKCPIGQNFK